MKNKYPIRGKVAYRAGLALRTESAILSSGRGDLRALEQHPPDVLVRRVIELAQHLVLSRVKLPQIECLSLARKDPAEEHNLDHIDKLDFLAYHVFNIVLESRQLHR